MFRVLNNLYGQAAGYGRRRIRREVETAAQLSAAELERRGKVLFDRRVRDAVGRFPAPATDNQYLARPRIAPAMLSGFGYTIVSSDCAYGIVGRSGDAWRLTGASSHSKPLSAT